MKRILCLSAVALVGLAPSAFATPFVCLNHGIKCICPPQECPDCCPPCNRGHHHCSCRKTEHARKLIDQLNSSDCCCDRIKAAEKLGSRLHADFCCDPEVLSALVHALLCDPCWEVRRAAAWSIAYQNARTEQGVMALYLASKMDPHYLVRDAANDALGVLLVCRRECFKDTFAAADDLAKKLGGRYKPGTPECLQLLGTCGAADGPSNGILIEEPAPAPPGKPAPAPLPKGSETADSALPLQAAPTAAPLPR